MRQLVVSLLLLLNSPYTQAKITCSPKEFPCRSGDSCIRQRWQCDGDADCPDRSDEDPAICGKKTCSSDQFTCGLAGMCIPQAWRCDDTVDCPDGSDEHHCVTTVSTEPTTKPTTKNSPHEITEQLIRGATEPTTTNKTQGPMELIMRQITQGTTQPITKEPILAITKPKRQLTGGTKRPTTIHTTESTTGPTKIQTTPRTTARTTKGILESITQPKTEGSTTAEPGLTVEISPGDTEITRRVGSSLELQCSVHGLPTNATLHVTWYANGKEVGEHSRVFVRSTSPQSKKLYMFDIADADRGTYWCEASSGGDIVRRAFSLIVFNDINFDHAPATQYLWSGSDTLIQCEASGDHVSTVWWRKQGEVIKSGGRYVYEPAGLRIYKVTRADTGLYTCVADVAAEGRVKETLITVIVRG